MRSRLAAALRCVLPLVLACLYPVLSAWSTNRAELSLSMIPRSLLCVLGGGGILGLLLLPLSRRNPARLSVATTLIVLIAFSFDLIGDYVVPNLFQFVSLFGIGMSASINYPTGVAVTVLGILATVVLCFWPARRAERLLPGLLLLTGLQALLCLPSLLRYQSTRPSTPLVALPHRNPVAKESAFPDLYCIVLDAYGRQDVLQHLFGIDNEPFLRALEQRGFFVARHSRANYLQTPLALAAAFNLDYLPALLPKGHEQEDASRILDKNRTAALLRQKGFQYVSVPTGIAQTALSSADITLDHFAGTVALLSPLDRLVIAKTPFSRLLENENASFDEHRSRLLSALENNLPAAAALPYPKFVLAHILAPHPPFVFGPNGELRIPNRASFTIGDASDYGKRGSHEAYREGYASQLTFLNKKVLESLDVMRRNQRRPAIIVLMGDHGSRMETDWKSLEHTNLKEPFANLMAVSTPDGGAGALLGDSVSPVNVFRLLLTRYYGQQLPRLPDRSYYSTLQEPFRFTDVTDRTP